MSTSVQRQYLSPNCILSLEGFSEDQQGDGQVAPVMTILTSVQCQFIGIPSVLSGGLNFLQNLIAVVSAYSQEKLSGLTHPLELSGEEDYITLDKLSEKNRYQLIWQETKGNTETQKEIELSAVQLFDLQETLDQLCADKNTLPQLKDDLQPLSRRYRNSEQSFIEQSTPATVGITGLVVAAIALFMIPNPAEIKNPNLEPRNIPSPLEETIPEGDSFPLPSSQPE